VCGETFREDPGQHLGYQTFPCPRRRAFTCAASRDPERGFDMVPQAGARLAGFWSRFPNTWAKPGRVAVNPGRGRVVTDEGSSIPVMAKGHAMVLDARRAREPDAGGNRPSIPLFTAVPLAMAACVGTAPAPERSCSLASPVRGS